jgi:hypothetical protein
MTVDELRVLAETSETIEESYGETRSVSVRFGRLNIICITDEKLFDVWEKSTAHCVNMKPVSREWAMIFMERKRQEAGFYGTQEFDMQNGMSVGKENKVDEINPFEDL